MGETMIAPPGPEEPPADSFLSRALGVFISPGTTFESIVWRPDFLAPLITVIVSAVVVTEVMFYKIGAERIVRQSLEISGRASKLSPEQMEQAVHQGAMITAILGRVAGFIGPPIYMLVIAALGLLIVNAILGGSVSLKTGFSIVSYASLVTLVGAALGLVVILYGDPEQFNPQNFMPTTVGFFLNLRETSRPLYAIASSFDVFRIWLIILTSLGLSIATGKKVRPTPIFLCYLGMWMIWVLGVAGLTMLTG